MSGVSDALPVVRIGNVQRDGIDMNDRLFLTGVRHADAARKTIRRTTVLMVGSNGNPERVGNAYLASDEIRDHLYASFLIGIDPGDETLASFLWRWLQSSVVQRMITQATAGSTGLKNLSLGWLRDLPVPLPSRAEQRRIVDLVSGTDTVIGHARSRPSLLQGVERAIVDRAFASQPNEVFLGDLAEVLVGFAFDSTDFTDDSIQVRLLRGDNITPGELRWTGAKHLHAVAAAGYTKYDLRPNDIVVAMDRPVISRGVKRALVRPTDVPALLVQRVARLRAHDAPLQAYIYALLGSSSFEHYLESVQTGGHAPHVSGLQINGFLTPTLGVGEMESIARCATATLNAREAAGRLIGAAESLRAALLTDLLSGEREIPEAYDALLDVNA